MAGDDDGALVPESEFLLGLLQQPQEVRAAEEAQAHHEPPQLPALPRVQRKVPFLDVPRHPHLIMKPIISGTCSQTYMCPDDSANIDALLGLVWDNSANICGGSMVNVMRMGSPRNRENAAAVLRSTCTSDTQQRRAARESGAEAPLRELGEGGTDRARRKAASLLELICNNVKM